MAKREGLKRKRAPAREDSNVVRLSLYIKDFFTINVAASRIVKAKINKLFWTMQAHAGMATIWQLVQTSTGYPKDF